MPSETVSVVPAVSDIPCECGRPQWIDSPDVQGRAQSLAVAFEQAYGRAPTGVWAAPGRANLMGEYIDFSGGMCLPFAHQYVTLTAAARRGDGVIHARSLQDTDRSVADNAPRSIALAEIAPGRIEGWFGYVAGVAWGMNRVAAGLSSHEPVPEMALPQDFGADVMVDSTVPIGAGLASSAALECSVALALYSLHCECDEPGERVRRGLARACMDAENFIVGASTGGLDQTASLRAHRGETLALDCRTFDVRSLPADPSAAGLTWLAVDTRAPHQLADGRYGSRRAQCDAAASYMGVERLRDLLPEHPVDAHVAGVLARYDALVAEGVPLDEDPVGTRLRLRHSMTEMVRSVAIADLLSDQETDWNQLGRLLVEGHESMRDDCQVSVRELDLAVSACLEAGAVGAKVVGGGFGGSVIVLVPEDKVHTLAEHVHREFCRTGFTVPQFLTLTPSDAARRIL